MMREIISYHQFLNKLNPSYDDCPSPCSLAQDRGETVDLPDFCKECEVAQQWKFFRESFDAKVAERFKEQRPEWSFDSLYADAIHVMNVDHHLRGHGYPRGCDALLARCIDILRSERNRVRRIEYWELEQRRKDKG